MTTAPTTLSNGLPKLAFGAALPLALILLLWTSTGVGAQESCFNGSVDDPRGCTFDAPRWVGEFASLSANGLVGALTGGLLQHFRGGSFRDGFVRGALAGGIVYAGKRVASESFSGAGLLGRGIGAVGASAVRNVSAATPSFSRLSLPIGPLWLDLDTTTREIGARIDPAALVWTAYAIAESELEIDWGETLSSGTPVFLTNNRSLRLAGDTIHSAGVTNAGIVFLADVPAFGPAHARRQAAHERVHVIQEDQLAIMWTDPLGDWAFRRISALRGAQSLLFVNLSTEILRALGATISEHGDRPWELESIFLAR